MSLKKHGKNNKPNSLVEHPRNASDYPTRDELVSQLAQLRLSLEGAYETLDSIAPSTDPEITHKVSDMVDIINGLHECEFELMDLLAKDGYMSSPTPSRSGENAAEKGDEKLFDGAAVNSGTGENSHSRAASQEDLSLYGAYAVSSSRSVRNANELPKNEKSTPSESIESPSQIPPQDRVFYIKRLEEIQRVNERLVDRCRRLGLVLSRGFALDKNISSKMKEVKDIVATKEQAQRKILELKVLMQQVAEDKLDADISLAKIENDESYGRPFRYEPRLPSRGASSISPVEHAAGTTEDENSIKKPRSYLGVVDSTEQVTGPDYNQFLRGLRQPFSREHGERESAFVPIHNASHSDPTRDKNKTSSNLDLNNEVKAPRATGNTSLLRRVMEGGSQYSQNISQLDQQRQGRSSSARAGLLPSQPSVVGTLPNNLFRSNYSKSPPSMQSSSGMGSMNSRSMASLDNCRNELPPYLARLATHNHETEDAVGHRGFPERSNMSSNNLNKSYRQPTRSSSFYSELDFRNQEVFPTVGWEDDGIHAHTSPLRSRSPPEFRRRMLSTIESQQITDELNRVLRCRNPEDTLPLPQPNWWSSSSELGQPERHSFVSDHQPYMQRGKSLLAERTAGDCYTQIMQLNLGLQEVTQQLRNLTVSVAANKTATRDALMQHRFDLHSVTRCIRDVSDMISDSMKRIEGQVSTQTRLIMDVESRIRRLEDNQRTATQKHESSRDREWSVPGRPDFMVSQDLSFQYGHNSRANETDTIRDRETGSTGSMLNNQIPPGTRANNYWDNFRSYSRQNMLSKSNANVPQQFGHEASPSATETSRYTSSDTLNNTQPTQGSADMTADIRRNGSGKNLWATSGFYENMSSKKRNKDQKSQSTTLSSLSKSTGTALANCSAAEPLHSSRDSHPEPDENNITSTTRQPLYSRLSPRTSPYRRESDTGPLSRTSDFELPWPPTSSDGSRRMKFVSAFNNHVLQSPGSANLPDLTPPRDSRLDEDNPNSQMVPPKVDREKYIQNFETPRSETLAGLDDTRSSNRELLDAADELGPPAWVLNAIDIEVPHGSGHFSPPDSPILRPLVRPAVRHVVHPVMDNNENAEVEQAETRDAELPRAETASSNLSSSSTVPMNIRCEENAIGLDDVLGQHENLSRSSESNHTNNNI